MAGTIKVDSINADSNLALKIANTAVAFIDSSGLRPVSGNVSLDATATSKVFLPSANTVAIQTAGVTGLSVSSSQVVTLANALPVTSGGTGATSLSSITVGTATLATSATTSANLAGGSNGTIPYQSANGTTQMLAVGTSGQLLQTNGAGAPTWVTPSTSVGDHIVSVNTGNGTGSVSYDNRRYTTTQTNTGTAITYADSATQGSSFTINETGIYAIYMSDTSGSSIGVSLNSITAGGNITTFAVANRLMFIYVASGTPGLTISTVVKLTATDVVRPMSQGSITTNLAQFYIRKIGT